MPVKRTPALEAIANFRDRSRSRWPRRGDANNRIEPVARPHFKTSFTFNSGATIFTIGSCFARHTEAVLHDQGFRIPAREYWSNTTAGDAADNWMLDNYGVPAILNELYWALGIGEPYDPKVQLFEVYPGKFADVHLPPRVPLCSFDEALSRRERIFSVNRSIATADAAIITLGLVEVWWDKVTKTYLNTRPYETVIRADPDRFELHVLGYDEIYAQLDVLFATIFRLCSLSGIILTVSPIPMSATYTGYDVAVANQYSKSVLRAAAEAIVEKYDRVDYFPSYETVVLSERSRAWTEDLIHATPEMIELNVSRLLDAYLAAGESAEIRNLQAPVPPSSDPQAEAAIANARKAKKAGNFAAAIASLEPFMNGPAATKAMRIIGECQFELGQLEPAETTFRRSLALRFNDPHTHGFLGLILQAQGRSDEAIAALRVAVDYPRRRKAIRCGHWGRQPPICSRRSRVSRTSMQFSSRAPTPLRIGCSGGCGNRSMRAPSLRT